MPHGCGGLSLSRFRVLTVIVIQVRKFVIRREVQPKKEGAKPYTKAPRIQRLVTPQRLQHKRHRIALKRRQAESSKDAAVSLGIYLQEAIKQPLTSSSERVRPDHAQACRRGEVQARRDPQAPCLQHAQVDYTCACIDASSYQVIQGTRCSIWAGDLRQWSSHWEVSSSLRVQRWFMSMYRTTKSRRSSTLHSGNQWRPTSCRTLIFDTQAFFVNL